jgi:hypothetical protein
MDVDIADGFNNDLLVVPTKRFKGCQPDAGVGVG